MTKVLNFYRIRFLRLFVGNGFFACKLYSFIVNLYHYLIKQLQYEIFRR